MLLCFQATGVTEEDITAENDSVLLAEDEPSEEKEDEVENAPEAVSDIHAHCIRFHFKYLVYQ